MICGIIVRILCDARMVAPGVVLERGDRLCGHRIRRSFASPALNQLVQRTISSGGFQAIRVIAIMHLRHHVHLPWLSGRIPVKVTLCRCLFARGVIFAGSG
jgi:hypothetical protein